MMSQHISRRVGGVRPRMTKLLWPGVLLLAGALMLIAGAATGSSDAGNADAPDVRLALAQLPFATEIGDHFESLGTCERQAQVTGFVSPSSLDQIADRLGAREWAAVTHHKLSGRRHDVVWASWWQGNTLLTAVVRPLASPGVDVPNTGGSRGLLIVMKPLRSRTTGRSSPSQVPADLLRSYALADAIPGRAMGLADDQVFLRLLATGRLSCSRAAEQTHWTLVAHGSIAFERMLTHFDRILLPQFGSYRRLDDGTNTRRALLLVTDKGRQLLLGLHGTAAGTGVVIHAVERSAPVVEIGARSWNGQ